MNIYNKTSLNKLRHNDEISDEEEAFMQGYLSIK